MKLAIGFGLVAGVLLFASSLSAAPSIDRQGVTAPSSVELAQYRYERICRRLRRDCMRFDGAGDRADCRRYRRHCTRWWR
jgi:hypothetical protein